MSVDNYLLHKLSKDELIKIIEFQNRPLYVVYNANATGYHCRALSIDMDICICNNKQDATKKHLEMAIKAFDDEFFDFKSMFDWDHMPLNPLLKTLLEGFTLNELQDFSADMLYYIFEEDEEIIEFINKFIQEYGSKLDCHINDVDMKVCKLNNKMTLSFSEDDI
jgi:hypothetical protein